MKKALVKLPNGDYVNPAHVTCVEFKSYSHSSETLVWVKKNAGYGTGQFAFVGDRREELAKILNQ
jgi:hypothetical protein